MPEQIRTGENAFQKKHGRSFFDSLTADALEVALFHNAMDSMSKMSAPAIAAAYDFSGFDQVVDVAGGKGALLISILTRNPSLHGVLFDSASVITASHGDASLGNRLQKVAGDFLTEVPSGGDVYILNRVLHNWNDETAIRILRACRSAIMPQGRLLVIEMTPPEQRNTGNNWAAMDLLMMLLFDGRVTQIPNPKALRSKASPSNGSSGATSDTHRSSGCIGRQHASREGRRWQTLQAVRFIASD
jgi:O-methyltransferase domain